MQWTFESTSLHFESLQTSSKNIADKEAEKEEMKVWTDWNFLYDDFQDCDLMVKTLTPGNILGTLEYVTDFK